MSQERGEEGQRGTCQVTCIKAKGLLWLVIDPPFTFCLSRVLLLFTAVYARLSGPHHLKDSPPATCFAIGMLGLQMCATMSSFTWVLKIQTQVTTFVWQALSYHLIFK